MPKKYTAAAIVLAGVVSASLAGQTVGPDVVASGFTDVVGYGQTQGITAFSVGTIACNVGTTPAQWIWNTNQHPVIAQNMYRYLNGEFVQIGQSWVKHGFYSTNSPGCGTCTQPPGGGNQLGVGCSDAYGASLNGNQSTLGPRSQVNAATGAYPLPYATPTGDATIAGRLQVKNADLDPVLNAGARYFVEAHYVTADDAAAGNKNNNATWQEIAAPAVGAAGGVPLTGVPHPQQAAIHAWQALDPAVAITPVDVDGRILIAHRGTNFGYGVIRHQYAIYNMSSDRAVRSVTINFPSNAVIQNLAFRDVDYHSGEPYTGADWTPALTPTSLSWATQTYATNPNANALRWGTTYTFSFESSVTPSPGITLGLFRPGVPATVTANVVPAIACPPQPLVPPVNVTYSANTAAPYDFVDISATGAAGPTGDDSSLLVSLGFTFALFGTPTTQFQISTNGFLALPGHDATSSANGGIPDPPEPNGIICGYWDDLNAGPTGGGSIKYQTIGSAPNRRFVVEYVGVWHAGMTAASAETLEIILDEGTNGITTTCITTPSAANGGSGVSATCGIESANGLAGIRLLGTAVNGKTVRYTPVGFMVPTSANLTLTGNGTANTTLALRILSTANKPLILAADTSPGPTGFGALGSINLGLSPGFVALADGVGVFFFPPNPATATEGCGNYVWSYAFGGSGLPSGFVVYFQGVVMDPAAPNGSFHLTTPRTLTVP